MNKHPQREAIAPAESASAKLSVSVKLGYGAGELGPALVANMLILYLLFFLTNVVGIPPALAGVVPMVGKFWDAINDPLIGWLSDHTKSARWGRRLSWMVVSLVPCAVIVLLLWWVPPLHGDWALFSYYVVIVFLYNAVSSAITVPHTSLMPEMTADYDERTTLVGYRSAFSILGSVGFIILAGVAQQLDFSEEGRYFFMGATCALILSVTVLWCVFGIRRVAMDRERYLKGRTLNQERFTIGQQLRVVFTNRPFLIACAVFTFSWLAVQVTATVLIYYAVYCMGVPERLVPFLMLSVMGAAVATLPLWVFLSHRLGKKATYGIGMGLWIAAQTGLLFLQPGQNGLMYALAVTAGMGVSTAYLIPYSLIPEVIEYDELETGHRREGIYYGFMVFLQKIGIGLAIFLVGIALESAGFVPSTPGGPSPVQPSSALTAIRIAIGPLPGMALILGLLFAWRYPLTKQRYADILRQLEARRNGGDPV